MIPAKYPTRPLCTPSTHNTRQKLDDEKPFPVGCPPDTILYAGGLLPLSVPQTRPLIGWLFAGPIDDGYAELAAQGEADPGEVQGKGPAGNADTGWPVVQGRRGQPPCRLPSHVGYPARLDRALQVGQQEFSLL